MTIEVTTPPSSAAVPTADELAAIVAVLESHGEHDLPVARPLRSRWREAARSFETHAF